MLNYIKSEFYRIFHSLSTYVTLGIFVGLALLINCGLAIFAAINPGWGYGNTSFSMQFLLQLPSLYVYAAAILVYILYEGIGKNGSLKNAVAFGVSREKIMLSQLIVSLIFCLGIMLVTLGVYFASAYALLRHEGIFSSADVMQQALAVLPSAVASLLLAVLCVDLTDRGVIGILIWLAVFVLVPYVCQWIGYQVDFFAKAASWMPMNFMDMMNATEAFWQTKDGIIKCLVSGAAGTAIFALAGWLVLRRKEI